MNIDDSGGRSAREIRRFRAVWSGVMAGSMLVIAGATVAVLVAGTPRWHRAGGDLPGADLRWFLIAAALAALVPMCLHILARARRSARLDAADVAVTATGIAGSVAVLFWSRDQRDAADAMQSLPGVVNSGRVVVVVCLLGAVVGTVNLAARRARLEHRSRHRLRRRFGVAALAATAVVGVLVTAVAWPLGASPTVAAAAHRGTGWVTDGYHGERLRIDWHETPTPDAWERLVPAAIAGGFALAGPSTVTGFVGGRQVWTVDLARPVVGVWGSEVSRANSSSPVIAQIRDEPTGTILTYGIDGDSGRIDWSTDAVGEIRFARVDATGAGLLTWRDDAATVVELGLGDGVVTERVAVDPPDGCDRPSRFDVVDGAITVPLVCGGVADRLVSYAYDTGRRVREYTGADFGAPGAGVRVSAVAGGVAAVDVHGPAVRSTAFVAPADAAVPAAPPSGWTVTGLARAGDDWTITGVDPAGRAAVIYTNPVRRSRSIMVTGADGDRTRDGWASIGGSLVTTARYATPATVTDAAEFPQVAPVTFVGAPIPGSGTLQPLSEITVKASPCRLTRDASSRVFQVGGGVLVRCGGPPASRELFLLR